MKNENTSLRMREFRPGLRRSWWAAPVACLVVLLAQPVNAAFPIPDAPLTTEARVAPNILFILDTSGSMASTIMPACASDRAFVAGNNNDGTTGCDTTKMLDRPADRSYRHNTIYYNPNVTYEPWMQANGARMTGGQDPSAAWFDWEFANDDRGTRDLRNNEESVFYVPKEGAAATTAFANFNRYWIRTNSGTTQVVTSAVNGGASASQTVNALSWGNTLSFSVPAGTVRLEVHVAGQPVAGGNLDVYARQGTTAPDLVAYTARSNESGSTESIVIQNPAQGAWRFRVANVGWSNVQNASMTVITYSSAVSVATPTGRTQAEELRNFATWYSYHRTRAKAAKAGASDAFTTLDSRVRVGYHSINGLSNFNIPVGDGNDGRFVDNVSPATTSRSTWFQRLHNATARTSGTPLGTALNTAGEYFSQTGSSGPYGPESGAEQFTCRQNFAILTTDGYWTTRPSPSRSNADGTAGTTITGPNGQSYRYAAVSPYSDDHSNTLADVAMYYWKRDLRPETWMVNNVATTSANPAFWQHMVTFGISIGLSGSTGWSAVSDVPANASWPDPGASDAAKIDDLLHAAVNGRGGFVSASNPEQFTAGLRSTLAAISERSSSFSNVAANSVSLEAGARVFNASYVSGVWTGQVTAKAVSSSGVSADAIWTSSIPALAQRNVFTFDGTQGATFPTTAQETALERTGGIANYPVSGADNASYLKGDRTREGPNVGQLRVRESLLGDIVGSSPAYVRDTDTLYVAANDGMLHAFDAANGRELFAFVPGIVNIGNMATLSRGDYVHKFLVDGPVTVSNRQITPDKNLLFGSLGKGGRGMYALDVTDPDSFSASNVLWESNTANMGLVMSQPIVARVRNSATTVKPAVVVSNGVNSANNRAVLIVLDAETGDVIREIDTGVGSAAQPNGLSAPTGVYGADGRTLSYVYAGDMLGNVWKFDLSNGSATAWTVSKLFAAGTSRPISGRVAISIDPKTRKRWVFFGTGRYLTVSDADPDSVGSQATQGMYGFAEDTATLTSADLVQRTIAVTSATVDGYPSRAFEVSAPIPADKKGWFINLPQGERIVQDAQVVSGMLVTASMLPSGNACDAGGTGFINALSAFTGTSGSGSYFDLGPIVDPDNPVNNGLPVGSVNLGVGMPTLPNLMRGLLAAGGSAGSNIGSVGTVSPRWERVSWREVRRD
ncbi:PilC/PilY family type IV pilus protein [Luteimonas terrae]|uniref:Type IV pilus assembly protein PilY1 n=1 Tax=Luteimonas terrae TaxID=1530191 RepID=A0ABU1XRU9_9GAMM|nr:PilC/PilY family type IV pilus protein [Luteimonas terrae]MDR7191487.1 type IV pilus assembly protein PilY1 [Luteimonas terrae]